MNWTNLKIIHKLVICLIAIGLLPLMLVGGISYYLFSEALLEKSSSATVSVLNNNKRILEQQMEQIESLSSHIAGIDSIIDVLLSNDSYPDHYDSLATRAQIGYTLNRFLNVDGISSIDLLGINGTFHHVGHSLQKAIVDIEEKQRWLAEARDRTETLWWSGISNNIDKASKEKKVLSLFRIVRTFDKEKLNLRTIGLVVINFSPEYLHSILSDVDLGEGGHLLITDNDNRLIYHPDISLIGTPFEFPALDHADAGKEGQLKTDLDSEEMVVNYTSLSLNNWLMMSVIPETTIYAQASQINNITMISIGCSFIFIIIAALMATKSVVKPIQEIIASFKNYQNGETGTLTERKPITGKDEVAELVHWFRMFVVADKQRKRLMEEQTRSAQLAALGTLAAGVAHEINNPIQGIINYADLLTRSPDKLERNKDIADRIKKEGERIAKITQDLLFYSKDSRSDMKLADLNSTISAALSLIGTKVKNRGVTLEVELEDGIPQLVLQAQSIQQVVMNLVDNAYDALEQKENPQEHKRITVRSKQLMDNDCASVLIEVIDNGVGMPTNVIQKAQEAFFTTKPPSKGTGLGLSIVNDIVKKHDGRIEIDSTENERTRIGVIIPIRESI